MSRWQCKPLDLTQTAERKHIFTHVEWELYGVYLTCGRQDEQFVWKTAAEIAAEISLPTGIPAVFSSINPKTKTPLLSRHFTCRRTGVIFYIL